jgi:hypothetical protein
VVIDLTSESEAHVVYVGKGRMLTPLKVWRPVRIDSEVECVLLCNACVGVIIDRIRKRVLAELSPPEPIRLEGSKKEGPTCPS